jgi:predicted RNA binding protein YcfA (HicA-like mRNA interferase family)
VAGDQLALVPRAYSPGPFCVPQPEGETRMHLTAVERLLRAHGLTLLRQESSHRIYADDAGRRLLITAHNRRVNAPRWVLLRDIKRAQAGP